MITILVGIFLLLCADLSIIALVHAHSVTNQVPLFQEITTVVILNIVLFIPALYKLKCLGRIETQSTGCNSRKNNIGTNKKSRPIELDKENETGKNIWTARLILIFFFLCTSTGTVFCFYAIYSGLLDEFPFLFCIAIKSALLILGTACLYVSGLFFACIIIEVGKAIRYITGLISHQTSSNDSDSDTKNK